MPRCDERKGMRKVATVRAQAAVSSQSVMQPPPSADWPDPDAIQPWQRVGVRLRILKSNPGQRFTLVCLPFMGPDSNAPKRKAWVERTAFVESSDEFLCAWFSFKPGPYRRLYQELVHRELLPAGGWDDYDGD